MDSQEMAYERFRAEIAKGCHADLACLCTIWAKVKVLRQKMGDFFFEQAVEFDLCAPACTVPVPKPGIPGVPSIPGQPTSGPPVAPPPPPGSPPPTTYNCPPPGQAGQPPVAPPPTGSTPTGGATTTVGTPGTPESTTTAPAASGNI